MTNESPAQELAERGRLHALQTALGPLLQSAQMPSGESALAHAQGTAQICADLGLDEASQCAAWLATALWTCGEQLDALKPPLVQGKDPLAGQVLQLLKLHTATRDVGAPAARKSEARLVAQQIDTLRRMLLAMAPDIRVVLIRLAWRLQTLRWYAASKTQVPPGLAQETLAVYAPLANRLGVWQIKWEMEDLGFRFSEPATYKQIAQALEEKRIEREGFIETAMTRLQQALAAARVEAKLAGRPKHIYSIHNKMKAKGLQVDGLMDLRALRVLVADIKDCYAALGVVHQLWTPLPREFDDYIARPKANGYQSLHTVVLTDAGKPLEVQIRTHDMHQHAEYGVAAHWRYKEGAAVSSADEKIAWLRQLLAWKEDVSQNLTDEHWQIADEDDRIFVLTPNGRVVELPRDATPIDFAYHVHTDVGHRCRGAKVNGMMVPLNTPLHTGETVEIVTDKKLDAGPSRDWLNLELGFARSQRTRAKVRAWFNALEHDQAVADGRDLIEKLLQKIGRTAINQADLAAKLGFEKPEDLYIAASKPEFNTHSVEDAFAEKKEEDPDALIRARVENLSEAKKQTKGSVLVVGVDVLTQLARCCKPTPPDEIGGFVTRGKGVSIHRASCSNFQNLARKDPGRVIACTWGNAKDASYAVDVRVRAVDRQGLLRDISEVFAKERINVTAVNTQSAKGEARMLFTVQVSDAKQLEKALANLTDVKGVYEAKRR
ncbi:MAG: RelA/SpoT family protein [Burkholderiaceae bacterium]